MVETESVYARQTMLAVMRWRDILVTIGMDNRCPRLHPTYGQPIREWHDTNHRGTVAARSLGRTVVDAWWCALNGN
jgi:hypothetical protein